MTENKYFQALIFSLMLHLALSLVLYKTEAPEWSSEDWNSVPIEVTYEKLHFRDKMYIKDPQVDDMLSRLKKDAKLLSRLSRRVKKETVASKTGRTQNVRNIVVSNQKAAKSTQAKTAKKALLKLDLTPSTSGLAVNKASKEAMIGKIDGYGDGVRNFRGLVHESTISEHIPNVAKAQLTALNTDQGDLRYYTFFTRQTEQVRPRWVRRLQSLMTSASPGLISRISQKTRTTTLEIILDKKGYWVGSILVKGSGVDYLDLIAKEAFQDAAPYLNPPKDMVEDDGYIYIPFSFRVEVDPSFFARQ